MGESPWLIIMNDSVQLQLINGIIVLENLVAVRYSGQSIVYSYTGRWVNEMGKIKEREVGRGQSLRQRGPSNLEEMLTILQEDYQKIMSDEAILNKVRSFLYESDLRGLSYQAVIKLFNDAFKNHLNNGQILDEINDLRRSVLGSDCDDQKDEIEIRDGHGGGSDFVIYPVKIVDYPSINRMNNTVDMRRVLISVEEDDVYHYLYPFLLKYFDDDLYANRNRPESGFEWYLTDNFFTLDSVRHILSDINDTIEALLSGRDNEYTGKLGIDDHQEKIIDFYRRFTYRMEYMINISAEKGYPLISFMGP